MGRITVKIESFRALASKTFIFQDGVTLFAGESGGGKTTVLEALLWALLGGTTRYYRDNAPRAAVTVIFENTLVPNLTIFRTGKSVTINGKLFSHSDGNEIITKMIGHANIIRSSYLRQRESHQFLTLPAAQRHQCIASCIESVKATELETTYKTVISECVSRKAQLEKDLSGIEAELSSFGRGFDHIDMSRDVDSEKAAIMSHIELMYHEINKTERVMERVAFLNQRIDYINSQLVVSVPLEALEQRLSIWTSVVNEISSLRVVADSHAELSSLEREVDVWEAWVAAGGDKLDDLMQQQASHVASVRAYDEYLHKLSEFETSIREFDRLVAEREAAIAHNGRVILELQEHQIKVQEHRMLIQRLVNETNQALDLERRAKVTQEDERRLNAWKASLVEIEQKNEDISRFNKEVEVTHRQTCRSIELENSHMIASYQEALERVREENAVRTAKAESQNLALMRKYEAERDEFNLKLARYQEYIQSRKRIEMLSSNAISQDELDTVLEMAPAGASPMDCPTCHTSLFVGFDGTLRNFMHNSCDVQYAKVRAALEIRELLNVEEVAEPSCPQLMRVHPQLLPNPVYPTLRPVPTAPPPPVPILPLPSRPASCESEHPIIRCDADNLGLFREVPPAPLFCMAELPIPTIPTKPQHPGEPPVIVPSVQDSIDRLLRLEVPTRQFPDDIRVQILETRKFLSFPDDVRYKTIADCIELASMIERTRGSQHLLLELKDIIEDPVWKERPLSLECLNAEINASKSHLASLNELSVEMQHARLWKGSVLRHTKQLNQIQSLDTLKSVCTKNLQLVKESVVESFKHEIAAINDLCARMMPVLFEDTQSYLEISIIKESKTGADKIQINFNFVRPCPVTGTMLRIPVDETSGGERQRISFIIAVAMCVVNKSPFIILDEPLTGVPDVMHLKAIEILREELPGIIAIVTSHATITGFYDRVQHV